KPRGRDLQPSTVAEYERMAKDYIYPVCGRKKIRDVTETDIIRIINRAKGRLRPETMARIRTVLSGTFEWAKRANPGQYVEWPEGKSKAARATMMKRQILTTEQIDALLSVDLTEPTDAQKAHGLPGSESAAWVGVFIE